MFWIEIIFTVNAELERWMRVLNQVLVHNDDTTMLIGTINEKRWIIIIYEENENVSLIG